MIYLVIPRHRQPRDCAALGPACLAAPPIWLVLSELHFLRKLYKRLRNIDSMSINSKFKISIYKGYLLYETLTKIW